mmetsp:Transcript_24374/g.67893  ORF Transcript_24374/g.67893 Transcript_24374/m.67893 type:complete len:90 (-) Transcript_24374:539-808(-)
MAGVMSDGDWCGQQAWRSAHQPQAASHTGVRTQPRRQELDEELKDLRAMLSIKSLYRQSWAILSYFCWSMVRTPFFCSYNHPNLHMHTS